MGVGVYFNVAVNGIPIIAWWNATYLVVVSLWCGAGSIVDVKPAESSLKAIRQLNSTLALSCHRQVCLPTQLNFSRKQYPVAWLMMNYLHQTMQCRHATLAPHSPDLLQTEHVGVLVLNSRIWMRPYPLETLPALRQTLLKSGRTPCISEFEHE